MTQIAIVKLEKVFCGKKVYSVEYSEVVENIDSKDSFYSFQSSPIKANISSANAKMVRPGEVSAWYLRNVWFVGFNYRNRARCNQSNHTNKCCKIRNRRVDKHAVNAFLQESAEQAHERVLIL